MYRRPLTESPKRTLATFAAGVTSGKLLAACALIATLTFKKETDTRTEKQTHALRF